MYFSSEMEGFVINVVDAMAKDGIVVTPAEVDVLLRISSGELDVPVSE